MGGLGGVRNKICRFIINQKKNSHKLDPLVGCFGNVERKFDFHLFLTDFVQEVPPKMVDASPGIVRFLIFFLSRKHLQGHRSHILWLSYIT